MNSTKSESGEIERLNSDPNNPIPSSAYLLQHVREGESGEDDVKMIGVYSTRQRALEAIQRLSLKPGFRDFPDGFYIDEYPLDEDHWEDGFGCSE